MAKAGAPKTRDNQLLMAAVWRTVTDLLTRDRVNQLNPQFCTLVYAKDVAKACRKIMSRSNRVNFVVQGENGVKAPIHDWKTLQQWFQHAEKNREDEEKYPTLYYATKGKADWLNELNLMIKTRLFERPKAQRGRPKKLIKTVKIARPRGRPPKPVKVIHEGVVAAPQDMRTKNLSGWG